MINKIALTDFRNFRKKVFEFSKGTTIIVGPNASGKTNILEGLYLLSTGKSFKAKIEEEMVNYDVDIARIRGKTKGNDLEVVLTRGLIDIGTDRPEKVTRKKLLLNGISKRLVDFVGNFRVTLFAPSDLGLVTESPSTRRNFLDHVLSLTDREYRRASLSYEKGLRQRNRLLFRIREEGLSRGQLLFWDKLLIKNGDYISAKREELIEFANNQPDLNEQKFSLEYDKSAISETRLDQYKEEEVAAATTLVGPHRDDFLFKIRNPKSEIRNSRDLSRFGSRGEQRMAVLWLKLAELSFLSEAFKAEGLIESKPTLLLDDIFSELDHEHRDIVMQIVENQSNPAPHGSGQTIITTADPHFLENFKKVNIIKLKS
ncbi:MAG: DNA replication and repair protein RecF [Patescibacteria group bacterium]